MIKRLIFKNLYPIISSISSFTSAEKLPITNYAKHTNAKQSSSEGITFNFNALSMLIYIIMAIYRVYPMTSNSLHDGAVTQLTEKIADEPALSSQGSMMKLTETQTRPKKNENPIVSCIKPETKVTREPESAYTLGGTEATTMRAKKWFGLICLLYGVLN